MTGVITDLQRFSLNDGPGIRTTVFFKGCNMNCSWCHNPETISMKREVYYVPENCINCFKCVNVCTAIAHKKFNGAHQYFSSVCVQCGKCAGVCHAGAMVTPWNRVTVDELMKEIAQDIPYYRESGGGVTLSGGEVFCQQEFADALTDACAAMEIPVAVETNLAFPFAKMEPLLRKLDLIMFDIKIFDEEKHREHTGIGNRQILENAKNVASLGIPLIARTPLIPGATDSEDNPRKIADFVNGLDNVQAYELLNFNPLGASKYQRMGRENPFKDSAPLSPEKLERIKASLADISVPVVII